MLRRACLVGLILLCATPAPARQRGSLLERASAAAAAEADSADGVDLGAVLRRLSAEGRSGAEAAPTGRARVTRAEWRGLLDRAQRAAGEEAATSDARALAVLHRAYARRAGIDETSVSKVRALVLARLEGDPVEPEIGGGARAWLAPGQPRPLGDVAPEVLARVNAEILASSREGGRGSNRLRDRLRRIEVELGADPRAAATDLAVLATEPALGDPALRDLLDADVWTTGPTAR